MRALIQRVLHAKVDVDGQTVGEISQGLCIFLCVMQGDTAAEAELLAAKCAKLRIFEDENGKMNRSVLDVGGGALAVSQFTLCADCRKGNRPSFSDSAAPDTANALYMHFAQCLRAQGVPTAQGVFAADMQVHIQNDGPVTIWLDSEIFKQSRR